MGAAQKQQAQVDVGSAVVAHRQSAEAFEPREGALDDPAFAAQRALCLASFGDIAAYVVEAAVDAVGLAVVGLVGVRSLDGLVRRHGLGGFYQGGQSWTVSDVGGAECRGERNALLVGTQVVFATWFASVARVGSAMRAPLLAGTSEESVIRSLARSRPCSPSSWTKCCSRRWKTPWACQSRRRRQAVMPEPQPISRGNSCHGMPVRRMNRMAVSTRRESRRFRPPLGRGGGGGNKC